MQTKEEVIIFPKYGHNYDVQGGPDVDQLLAALKDPKATVKFTFVGEVDSSLITSDVEVQINSALPVDAERVVFKVGGSVITERGTDVRITIQHYDTTTKHGTQAGIFL